MVYDIVRRSRRIGTHDGRRLATLIRTSPHTADESWTYSVRQTRPRQVGVFWLKPSKRFTS